MALLCSRRVDPVRQSPRLRSYGSFTNGTVPPRLFTHLRPFPSLPSSPAAFPGPFCRRFLGREVCRLTSGTTQPSANWPDIARRFASAYRLAHSGSHPEIRPVFLRSHIVLPCRAIRKHLGTVGE